MRCRRWWWEKARCDRSTSSTSNVALRWVYHHRYAAVNERPIRAFFLLLRRCFFAAETASSAVHRHRIECLFDGRLSISVLYFLFSLSPLAMEHVSAHSSSYKKQRKRLQFEDLPSLASILLDNGACMETSFFSLSSRRASPPSL